MNGRKVGFRRAGGRSRCRRRRRRRCRRGCRSVVRSSRGRGGRAVARGARVVVPVPSSVRRCRPSLSPVIRAGGLSVVLSSSFPSCRRRPCRVARDTRGGLSVGCFKVLSSSGCRRRRAVGLSLSSRRRSSCRRRAVRPSVGLSRWVRGSSGRRGCRSGAVSSVAGVALAGRRRRPVGVVPVPPWWGVVVGCRSPCPPLRGAVACFTLHPYYTLADTTNHARLQAIIHGYTPQKLQKAPKSSRNQPFI